MPVTFIHPMVLDDNVWETLEYALKQEPKIDSTRNSAKNLKELYQQHLAVVLMEGKKPIGFIAAWPVAEGFVEIGSVWIHPVFRGTGLSHKIYDVVPSLPGIQQVVAYGVTTNVISVHVGKRIGLEITHNWVDPVPFHLSCGPCELVAKEDHPTCLKRNKSCWLRVLISTEGE